MTKQKTLFIAVCPKLVSPLGHDYTYQLNVKKCFRHYICMQNLASNIRSRSFVNFFPSSFFGKLIHFFLLFFQFRKRKRTFLIETLSTSELLFLTISTLFFSKDKDSFKLILRHPPTKKELWGIIQKLCLRYFNCIRTTFYSDTESLRACYRKFANLEVVLLPIPHIKPYLPHVSAEKKIIWWPGSPRHEKGLDFMKRLPSRLDFSKYELHASADAQIPHSTCLPSTLSEEEYTYQLSLSDIIILPYDPSFYQHRSSGIFVEAILAGKAIFVSAGTWAANELEKHEEVYNDDMFSEAGNQLVTCRTTTNIQKNYSQFHNQKVFAQIISRE